MITPHPAFLSVAVSVLAVSVLAASPLATAPMPQRAAPIHDIEIRIEARQTRKDASVHTCRYHVGSRTFRTLDEVTRIVARAQANGRSEKVNGDTAVVLRTDRMCTTGDLVRVLEALHVARVAEPVLQTDVHRRIRLRLAKLPASGPEQGMRSCRARAFVPPATTDRAGASWTSPSGRVHRVLKLDQRGRSSHRGKEVPAAALEAWARAGTRPKRRGESKPLEHAFVVHADRRSPASALASVVRKLESSGASCVYLGVSPKDGETVVVPEASLRPVAPPRAVGASGSRPPIEAQALAPLHALTGPRRIQGLPIDAQYLPRLENCLEEARNAGVDPKLGIRRDTARRALLALVLLARGNTLRRGSEKTSLKGLIMWLRGRQRSTPELDDEGLALRALALIEAQALTPYRTLLRDVKNAALALLDRRAEDGLWSTPRASAFALEALRSAEAAGIELPATWRAKSKGQIRRALQREPVAQPASTAWSDWCTHEGEGGRVDPACSAILRKAKPDRRWPELALAAQVLQCTTEGDGARIASRLRLRADRSWRTLSALDRAYALLALHAPLRYARTR